MLKTRIDFNGSWVKETGFQKHNIASGDFFSLLHVSMYLK